MKQKLNTRHYSKLIAKKVNIEPTVCQKVIVTMLKRLSKFMTEGNDTIIENYLEVRVNKRARVNYIKKVKSENENPS